MLSETEYNQLSQGITLDQRSSAKFRPDYPAEDEVQDMAMRSSEQYHQNYDNLNTGENNLNRHIDYSQSSVPSVFQPSLPLESNQIQESQNNHDIHNHDTSTGWNEGYMRHAQTMQDQIKQILEAQQRQIDQGVANHKRQRGVATFSESPEDFQPIDELSRESSIGATARSAQAGNDFMRSRGTREKSLDSKPKIKEVRSNSLRPQSAKKLKGMIDESGDIKGNTNKLGYNNTKANNSKSKAFPQGSDSNSKSSAQTCYELVLDFKYNGKKISKTMIQQNPLLNSMPTSANNKQQEQQQDNQQETLFHNQNSFPSKSDLLVPSAGNLNPETEATPSPLTVSNSLFLRLSPRKKGQLTSPSGTLLSGSVSGISNQSNNSELASFKRQITSLIASENEIKALITPTTPIRLNPMPQQHHSEQSTLGNQISQKQEIVSFKQQQQKQRFSQERERQFSGQNDESNEGTNLSERKRKLGGSQKQVVIQTEIIAQPAENALMSLHKNNSTPNKANLNHVPKKPCLKQPSSIKFPISCFEKQSDLAEDNISKQEVQSSEQVKCFQIEQENQSINENQGQQQYLNSQKQEQGRVVESEKYEKIDQLISQDFVGSQFKVNPSQGEQANQENNQIAAFNDQSNNTYSDSVNKYSQKYLQQCELSESKFTLRQQIEMKLLKAKQTKGAQFQHQTSIENRNAKNVNNFHEKQTQNLHNKSNDTHMNRFVNESDQKSRRDTSREQQSSKNENNLVYQVNSQRDRDLQEKQDYLQQQQQQQKLQFSNNNSQTINNQQLNKQERSNSLPKPSQQSLAQSALLRQKQSQQQLSIPKDPMNNNIASSDVFHRQPLVQSMQSSLLQPQTKLVSHEDDSTSNSHKSQSQLQRSQQPPKPPYSAITLRKTRAESNQESTSSENASQRVGYSKNPIMPLPNQSPFNHNSSNQNNSLNDSRNYNINSNNSAHNPLLVRQSSEKILPKTNILNSSNQYSKNYYNSSTERKSVLTLQKSNSNAQLPPKSFFYKPIGQNLLSTNNNINNINALQPGYSRWNQSKTSLSHSLASPNGTEINSGQTLATQSQDSRSLLQMNIIERNQAWLSQRQMKNEQRKQEAQLKEIEGCTFKPSFRSSSPGQTSNLNLHQQSQDEKQSIPPDSSRKSKESYHQVLGGSYFHSSANRSETALGYSQQFQANQQRKASFGVSNIVGVQDKTNNKLVYPFNSNIQSNQQYY